MSPRRMARLPVLLRMGTLLLVAAGPTACATTDCDPTQGGLIQGIRCDSSGGFDARIKDRQNQQASLLDQQMALEREIQGVEAQRAGLASQIETKQAEQARAEQQLAAVRRKLASGQQQNVALQKQAKSLEADIAKSKADINGLSQQDQQKKARLAKLSREQQNLDQEYKAATGGK
ncbi:MAG: hypothetical protein U1E42_06260 [Rhodospirillales bacterium]